jgi:methionyl-tRNA synthetase
MNTFLFNDPRSGLFLLLLTILWILPWKLFALWTAAKKDQKVWFIILLIVNTLGILEIIYIFAVAKKTWPEVKKSFVNFMSGKK